ncbi:hypothetical protein [Desulfoplanes sp.]
MNCLQTILDLEYVLDRIDPDGMLVDDFNELKDLVAHAAEWDLEETLVNRIEQATASFLHELDLPMALTASQGTTRTLQ